LDSYIIFFNNNIWDISYYKMKLERELALRVFKSIRNDNLTDSMVSWRDYVDSRPEDLDLKRRVSEKYVDYMVRKYSEHIEGD